VTAERRKSGPNYTGVFLWTLVAIIAVWAFGSWSLARIGFTAGDNFEALSALFSGLAFAALIVTLLMQREELRLQRQELRLTRKELARAAEAQEATQVQMQRQADLLEYAARLDAATAIAQAYKSINHTNLGPKITALEAIVAEVIPPPSA
jgi:hypothetical protein